MEGDLPGRKPPGFLARGMGDMRRDSGGRKAVMEARREWCALAVGVVRVRAGEVEAVGVVAAYCGDDTVSREGVRVICGVVAGLSAGLSTGTGLS